MKTNWANENAASRPFTLNYVVLATLSLVVFAGLNVYGWGAFRSDETNAASGKRQIQAIDSVSGNLPNSVWLNRTSRGLVVSSVTGYNLFDGAAFVPALLPDLEVSKTDGVSQINAGQSTVYTVTITNNGALDIIGATLMDDPGPGLTVTAAACAAILPNKCTADPMLTDLLVGGTTLPPLSQHDSYILHVTATVNQNAGNNALHNVRNDAIVQLANGQGGNSGGDIDSVTHTADLTVSKDDGFPYYVAGAPITYTMIVRNLGPSDSTGASVSDAVPANITGVTTSCSASGAADCGTNVFPTGNTVSFTGVNIPAGAANFVTITVSGLVSKSAAGDMTNSVHVTPGGQVDPDLNNNDASDTDFVRYVADLGVTKTDNSATYTPGAAISYQIVVSNYGPSNATGFSVADTVPASITGVTTSCSPSGVADCGTNNAPFGNNVSFTNAAIPSDPANFLTITVSGTVAPSTTGDLVNTVIVMKGIQEDPDLSNNTATDTDVINSVSAFVVTKDDGITRIDSGGSTTYTVSFTNNGPSPADGATIHDAHAAGMTKTLVDSCTATGSAACPDAGQLTIANLEAGTVSVPAWPVGGTITFKITVNVTATNGTMTNTVSVTTPPGTLNPTTVSASDTNDVVQRDFSDAPASYGTPSHVINPSKLRIGALLDPEPAALPTNNALGDDLDNLADEDGIAQPLPAFTVANPQTYSVTVNNLFNTTGGPATLYAWIDLNKDGMFSTGEIQTATIGDGTTNGSATLTWTGATFALPASQHTFLRLRLTTAALTDNVATAVDERSTIEAPDGEVEDYEIKAEVRGHMTICKQVAANDLIPVGTVFSFTSPSFSGIVQVPAGANGSPNCSAPIDVLAGSATVTETAQVDTVITDITANPANSLISKDLANGQGVINVAADPATATSITFTNHSTAVNTGIIEICKQIAQGDALAVGTN
ncbi:MAG: GEVED domain-containing protein, partial [Acidobacteriota bacterium]